MLRPSSQVFSAGPRLRGLTAPSTKFSSKGIAYFAAVGQAPHRIDGNLRGSRLTAARPVRDQAQFRTLLASCRPQQLRKYSVAQTLKSAVATHSTFSSTSSSSSDTKQSKPSNFRRVLGFATLAFFGYLLGFTVSPAPGKLHSVMTDLAEEARHAHELSAEFYAQADDVTRGIEDTINALPLVKELRADANLKESRPHLDIPPEVRPHNLTAGTLHAPDKIAVPPYVFSDSEGKNLVSISYLGSAVAGHPGIVHGGLLATMLDEGLARCCFPALPNKIGVTANLNVDYRRPAPAGSYFVLRAKTTKVEGRKAWVEGRIESLPEEGKESVVYVEAKALFIEPRNAEKIPKVYKVT